MAAPQKITGKGGGLSYKGAVLAIRKWSANVDKGYADSTDSSDYDPVSELVHKEQLAGTIQTEFDVEGVWDLLTTDASIVAELYSANEAGAAVFNLTPTVVYGSGKCDITNFKTDIVTNEATTVTWTATLKTNGIFTHGS